MLIDEIYLSPEKLLEISNSACERTFDEMPNNSSVTCLKNSMNYFANEVANIAQAVQEAESCLLTTTDKQENVRLLK